jgi:hypothetical protein
VNTVTENKVFQAQLPEEVTIKFVENAGKEIDEMVNRLFS